MRAVSAPSDHRLTPRSLVWRLGALIALAILLVFFVVGTSTLVIEYRDGLAQAHRSALSTADSTLRPVAKSVWNVDPDSLALLTASMVRDGSIVRVEVFDSNGLMRDERRTGPQQTVDKVWERELFAPEDNSPIGKMRITESYEQVREEFANRAGNVLLAEFIKLAVLAAAVVWLVERILSRPLRQLANAVDALPVGEAARITLPSRWGKDTDELGRLVSTINRLTAGQATELEGRISAEARLRDQFREIEIILGAVSEGVVALQGDGHLLYLNEPGCRLLDVTGTGDLVFSDVPILASLVPQPLLDSLRATALAGSGMAQRAYTSKVHLRGIGEVPVEVSVCALSEGPVAWVIVARDVSAEQAAAQAVAEREAERRANQAKTDFLSRMSHELRTPLNAVLGFSELMASSRTEPLGPQGQRFNEQIHRSGMHLLRLISDLLDLSRIEAGAFALNLRVMQVDNLVAQSIEMVAQDAAARHVELTSNFDGARRPDVNIDETRFKQVMVNLLSNAVKYNRPGGYVSVVVGEANGQLVITVSDSGVGMSAEQLAQLFTPFNRLGREASNVEGTGIGLVIAKRLVELMGGEIEATSTAGTGTVFRVSLPIARQSQSGNEPAGGRSGYAVQNRPEITGTLVYVEDNAINRLMLEHYLKFRPGVETAFASDFDEGLAVISEHAPMLALVDMNLGQRTGIELLARLKERPALAGTTWVALSADAMPEQVTQARAAGFDDYWVKPISLEDFLQRIDQIFGAPAHAADGAASPSQLNPGQSAG